MEKSLKILVERAEIIIDNMTKSKQYLKEYHEAKWEKKWGMTYAIIASAVLVGLIVIIYK